MQKESRKQIIYHQLCLLCAQQPIPCTRGGWRKPQSCYLRGNQRWGRREQRRGCNRSSWCSCWLPSWFPHNEPRWKVAQWSPFCWYQRWAAWLPKCKPTKRARGSVRSSRYRLRIHRHHQQRSRRHSQPKMEKKWIKIIKGNALHKIIRNIPGKYQ